MSESNPNSRLETFCDGVFAIALTLLIIDIKIPSDKEIHGTQDFWKVLYEMLPSVCAFLLSFFVILITWVNHHQTMLLVHKTSTSFIYANALLLLTVVFIPFPTALIGEYIFTNHPSPALILYNVTLALGAISWVLISVSALKNNLAKSEHAKKMLRQNKFFGFFACALYLVCAFISIWFPLTIAAVTVIIWLFWFVYGISLKHE